MSTTKPGISEIYGICDDIGYQDYPSISGGGPGPSSYEGFSDISFDVSTSGHHGHHCLEENLILKKQILSLKTELQTVWDLLYESHSINFAQMQPSPSPTTNLQSNILQNEVLIRTDFPDVHYWYRSDWLQVDITTAREEDQPSDINLKLRCLEDQHGVVVNNNRLREMRLFAKTIWERFKDAGDAPETWGVVNESRAAEYHREMSLRFQEFALCDLNWKSQLLATETYPNWPGRPKTNRSHRPRKAKTQGNTSSNDALSRVIDCPVSSSGFFTDFETDHQQFINSPTFQMDPATTRGMEVQWFNSTLVNPALGVGGFVADCIPAADFQPGSSLNFNNA